MFETLVGYACVGTAGFQMRLQLCEGVLNRRKGDKWLCGGLSDVAMAQSNVLLRARTDIHLIF